MAPKKRSESALPQEGEQAPNILNELAFKESPAPQIITENRRILQCNKAFAALFGFSIDELTNELILRLYPNRADYHEIGERCLRALHDSTSYEDERFMQHRRSEEHTSELQSLMRISYAVFCLKKKKKQHNTSNHTTYNT